MVDTFTEMPFTKKYRKYVFLVIFQLVLVVILLELTWNRGYLRKDATLTSENSAIFRLSDLDKQANTRNNDISDVDVHLEGDPGGNHVHKSSPNLVTVAIGLALTSRYMYNITEENLRYRFPFFRTLLSSFCKTSTQGYSYQFYVAYDDTDPFFTRPEGFQWFSNVFYLFRREICGYVTEMQLHLIQCTHSGKPAWAQNDAMMEAYLDHADYYYRVNDDSMLKSPSWTEVYIHALQAFDPPNVGVVGPSHEGGKLNILAYDFVHRTHIDIFGFYYPRLFTDWFADDWITTVYQSNRTSKVLQIKVLHTLLLGSRYENRFGNAQYLQQQVYGDQKLLASFLERKTKYSNTAKDPRKVISMELSTSDTNYVHGAIRNIRLAAIYLPEWSVRVYAPAGVLSPRILHKLNQSDVTIIQGPIDSLLWAAIMPYTVARDKSVTHFLKRDVIGRITQRDADLVYDWLDRKELFFCARDHPTLHDTPLIPGLFGANAEAFDKLNIHPSQLEAKIKQLLAFPKQELHYNFTGTYIPYASYNTSAHQLENWFLNEHVWPIIKARAVCYDSVHCSDWLSGSRIRQFPSPRTDTQFIGEHFAAFEVPVDFNVSRVLHEYQRTCRV